MTAIPSVSPPPVLVMPVPVRPVLPLPGYPPPSYPLYALLMPAHAAALRVGRGPRRDPPPA